MRRFLWLAFKILLIYALMVVAFLWVSSPEIFNPNLPDIDGMRAELNPRVNNSIRRVSIRDDLGHYYEPRSGVDPATIAAHCHPDGEICLKSSTLENNPSSFWHEAGHAYTFHLWHRGSAFFDEWERIGSLGALTAYGRTSPWEDVAEWVEHVYLNVNGYNSEFSNLWWLRWVMMAPMEPYRQKLELLRKYGFITEEDYRIFLHNNPYFQEETALQTGAVFN